jgi:hypothetical protein
MAVGQALLSHLHHGHHQTQCHHHLQLSSWNPSTFLASVKPQVNAPVAVTTGEVAVLHTQMPRLTHSPATPGAVKQGPLYKVQAPMQVFIVGVAVQGVSTRAQQLGERHSLHLPAYWVPWVPKG